ncbi:MAG: DNA-formamidopyrimidine glycosylase [Candidatus Aminicenantes bacterium]|nr:DNA-formamidopyrimidine glycosylase [Candidatus Aminicenantes bacterium]
MPELPEVETVVRGLRTRILGLVIEGVRVRSPHLSRDTSAADWRALRGNAVRRIRRRGKLILVDCEGGWTIVCHLKMTGQFLFSPISVRPDKHTHAVFVFRNEPRRLRFKDVRKFGFMCLRRTDGLSRDPLLAALGPEPLKVSLPELGAVLAGIGNIYADEILFESRLHPFRRAGDLNPAEVRRLWRAMRGVLRRALRLGGSTIRDFADCDGIEGEFQLEFKAYGRTGEPCPRCGRPIERLRLGQRSTHFCLRCQKA